MNRVVPSTIVAHLVAVLVAAGLVAVSPAARADVTRCDMLAAHPFDPQKVALGVSFADLDPVRAVAACTAALKFDGKNSRLRFELGRALERSGNYADAAKAYRQAADDNYVAAQTALGALYQNGLGVEPDAVQATAWYRKAAELGYAVAEDNLGLAYRDGRGIAQDEAQAQAWFKKAAAQFYQPAAAHLAASAAQAKAPATVGAPPAPVPVPASVPTVPAPALPQPPSPPLPAPAAPMQAQPAPPPPPTAAVPAPSKPQPPSAPPPVPSAPAQAKPPPARQEEAALADDPQFKSNVGVALTQCLLPEAQKADHSALTEDQAADLLIAKCQRPWVAWMSECIGKGDTQQNCIKKSTVFARSAIRQSNP